MQLARVLPRFASFVRVCGIHDNFLVFRMFPYTCVVVDRHTLTIRTSFLSTYPNYLTLDDGTLLAWGDKSLARFEANDLQVNVLLQSRCRLEHVWLGQDGRVAVLRGSRVLKLE